MAQVDLTPVVIWYAVSPNGVEIRVRTYAGDNAIKEESIITSEDALMGTYQANKAGLPSKTSWDEADIVASVPMEGVIWGGEDIGLNLIKDISAVRG